MSDNSCHNAEPGHAPVQIAVILMLVVLLSYTASSVVCASQWQDEMAAGQLVAEATFLATSRKISSSANRQVSLERLQQVMHNYPQTTAALTAEHCRADVLRMLGRSDEAIAAATSIVEMRPGTVEARWASLCIGRTLIDTGNARKGISELVKVAMGPLDAGSAPTRTARWLLGPLCNEYLKGRQDVMDAADFLGLDRDTANARALVLGVMARYYGREGSFSQARRMLQRLEEEAPHQIADMEWAKCHVAMDTLALPNKQLSTAKWAQSVLLAACEADATYADSACLALCRLYRKSGKVADAISLLERVRSTQAAGSRDQILYVLGSLMYEQSREDAAVAIFNELIVTYPNSTYAKLAEFVAASGRTLGPSQSIQFLLRAAYSRFQPGWTLLAFCPTNVDIDLPCVIAARLAALVKCGFTDAAVDEARIVGGHHRFPEFDSGCLLGEVALCAFTDSEHCKDLLEAGPHLALLMVPNVSAHSDTEERLSARLWMLREVARAVTDKGRCKSPLGERAAVLTCAADSSFFLAAYAQAAPMYQALLKMEPGRDARAKARHHLGICYWEMGDRRTAERYMNTVVREYGSTAWAVYAGTSLQVWRADISNELTSPD